MSDIITRQLELFINNNGTIAELKKLLSTCGNDKELLDSLKIKNNNK